MLPPSFRESFLRRASAVSGKLRTVMLALVIPERECFSSFLFIEETEIISNVRPGKWSVCAVVSLMFVDAELIVLSDDIKRWELLSKAWSEKRWQRALKQPDFIIEALGM